MQIHLDSNGLSLLRKGKQGFFRIVFSRLGLIVLLLALQVMVLFSIFQWFEAFLPHILGGTAILTAVVVHYLLGSAMEPTAKLT